MNYREIHQEVERQRIGLQARFNLSPSVLYLGPDAYYTIRKEARTLITCAHMGTGESYMGLRIYIISPASYSDEWHIKVA